MEIKPYIHKVQYYETDAMGVVHHSNYIRWFEEARLDYLEQLGYNYRQLEDENIVSPVLEITAKYKSSVRYGDTVKIKIIETSFNGVKLEFSYEITDAVTGQLRTTGSSRHCFLDREGHFLRIKQQKPEFYELLCSLQNI